MTALQPDEKVCPFCAETIKAAAIKCRYCGSELPTGLVPAGPARSGPALPESAPPEPAAPGPVLDPDLSSDPTPDPAPGVEPAAREHWTRSGRLTAVLLVLVLLAAGAAGSTLWRAAHHDAGVTGPIQSTSARTDGMGAATRLTEKALSYRWSSLAADMKAAEAVMTPGFRRQYTQAMAKVHDQTLKNHVTLKATVVASSVVSASDHEVRALVFVNQVTTTQGSQHQRIDQNRVLVTLTRGAGDWQISAMRAF